MLEVSGGPQRSPLAGAGDSPIYGGQGRKYSPATCRGGAEIETAVVLELWDSGVRRQAAPSAGDTPASSEGRSNGVDMDALIKSLRPGKPSDLKPSDPKPSDLKPSDAKVPDARPTELDPSEFLAAAVRADQPRPSRAEAEAAVETLLGYIGENPAREGLLDTPRRGVEGFGAIYQGS